MIVEKQNINKYMNPRDSSVDNVMLLTRKIFDARPLHKGGNESDPDVGEEIIHLYHYICRRHTKRQQKAQP